MWFIYTVFILLLHFYKCPHIKNYSTYPEMVYSLLNRNTFLRFIHDDHISLLYLYCLFYNMNKSKFILLPLVSS